MARVTGWRERESEREKAKVAGRCCRDVCVETFEVFRTIVVIREFRCFVRLRTTTRCPLILPRRLGGNAKTLHVMKHDKASCD